eukprot:1148208-Pelagomonas_calceolata.AAC.7
MHAYCTYVPGRLGEHVFMEVQLRIKYLAVLGAFMHAYCTYVPGRLAKDPAPAAPGAHALLHLSPPPPASPGKLGAPSLSVSAGAPAWPGPAAER